MSLNGKSTTAEIASYVKAGASITHGAIDGAQLDAAEYRRCVENEVGGIVQGWLIWEHELITTRVMSPTPLDGEALREAAVRVVRGLVSALKAQLRHVPEGAELRESPIIGLDGERIIVSENAEGKVQTLDAPRRDKQ